MRRIKEKSEGQRPEMSKKRGVPRGAEGRSDGKSKFDENEKNAKK
jgi:hypothetical protein